MGVEGEVGGGEFDVEEVFVSGEVQCAGFGGCFAALMEDVGDVFGAVGVELDGVFDGSGGCLFAVDFTQRDDFSNVDVAVEAPVLKLPDVFVGVGADAQELHEMLLIAGFTFLLQ